MFVARSTIADFEALCLLNVLGIQEKIEINGTAMQEFQDQLGRSPESWYRTGLLWKPECPDLPDNE